jgi:RimJ/RimL family protein N-acetyltransferase
MFATYAQDPDVTRFLIWRPHQNVSESFAVVNRFVRDWETSTAFCWFIFGQDTGEMFGSIAGRPDPEGCTLGFLLAQPYWGKGYMPEAITAITNWAFNKAGASQVSAFCDVDNHASARALEKAGFSRAGLFPRFSVHPNISELPRDCYRYVKVAADFHAKKSLDDHDGPDR